jgi:hypothetical protein
MLAFLGYRASFGVLVYHTFIWGFFFPILGLHFVVKIENGLVFWKWKFDKWKYMWSVHEWCSGRKMWNKPSSSNQK